MRAPGNVLLVDDEEALLRHLGRALREEGHQVVTATSVAEAQRRLGEQGFDVLVADNLMPGETGLDLIRDLATAGADRPAVVMITAHASVESAIAAMKLGAFDYLQKPFEVEELVVAVGRALEHQRLSGQHRYLLSEREEEFGHYGIVGGSRAVRDLLEVIEKVARSRSTVLLTGETGTGKELVARAIHDRSAAAGYASDQGELCGHPRGRCWSRNSSVTSGGHSPEPPPAGGESSASPMAARSFSTKSGCCPHRSSRSCCGSFRSASSSRLDRSGREQRRTCA